MRKNYFLIGVFALATITFAACSSEDKLGEERSDDNGNTEVIEGEPSGIFQDILHGIRGSGKAGEHAVRISGVGEYRVRERRVIPGPVSQHRTRRAVEQVKGLMVGQQQFKGAEQEMLSAAVHHLIIRTVTEIHAFAGLGRKL